MTSQALDALLFGAVAGFSLLLGSLIAVFVPVGKRILAIITAFGAGVLIASMSFGLMEEAYRRGGFDAAGIGLVSGGVLYYAAHWVLYRHDRGHRGWHPHAVAMRRPNPRGRSEFPGAASGLSILVGAVLDGLPEQFSIGVGVRAGTSLGFLVMGAVFLSNLPEAMAATHDLLGQQGRARLFGIWTIMGVISTITTMAGFFFAHLISDDVLGGLMAFAGGAVLAMVADTMLPDAFSGGGRVVSLATVLGFLVSFVLSRL